MSILHKLTRTNPPFWRSRTTFLLLIAAAVALFFSFTEHRSHLLSVLPYLFLLSCPLMHVFMHRGHHHGPSNNNDQNGASS